VQKHERPTLPEFVLTHEPITDSHLTEFRLGAHRPSLDRRDSRHRRRVARSVFDRLRRHLPLVFSTVLVRDTRPGTMGDRHA
jgi:hypothetical protein